MKKVVSIVLVALLLLNVMGYYGLFLGLKYRNDVRETQRLDAANYMESETITIKIPLAIPYYGDTEFERVNGEIEHQGEFFRLVKQKFQKDTLFIVCIRDVKRKHIQKALVDYVKTFANQSSDRSDVRTIPSFIKDYIPASVNIQPAAAGWSLLVFYLVGADSPSKPYCTSPSPPPKS